MPKNFTAEERAVISAFHRLFYSAGQFHIGIEGESASVAITNEARYQGIQCQKNPLDLWVYQEILHECRPDLIIELGTAAGGTTLFLAHCLDNLGLDGKVLSVDLYDRVSQLPEHEKIEYMVGDTEQFETWERITGATELFHRIMLILDDDHSKRHVLKELTMYGGMVSVGQFCIVEDTNISGHPIGEATQDGPYEAVSEYLQYVKYFERDLGREKFLMTFNPGGYLRRVR